MHGQMYVSKYRGDHSRLGPHKKPREDLREAWDQTWRQYGGYLEYAVDSRLTKVWAVFLDRHILANGPNG